MEFFQKAKTYADMIKLAHTLFALPLALSAAFIAYAKGAPFSLGVFIWIVVAFTAARSAAMGFNRIVDADVDALNERTKSRPTVSGKLPIKDAKVFTWISAGIFIFAALMINNLCFVLSFPALALLFGYSYAKRFTCLAHYILGAALFMAPVGAWIAVMGSLDARILFLGAFLLFSIAGFDLIYALQDMDFDITYNLHSIPARFGRKATLAIAALSFAVAAVMLFATGASFALNTAFFLAGILICALYIAGFITILKAGMKKVNLVFFYINASISILILIATLSNLVF